MRLLHTARWRKISDDAAIALENPVTVTDAATGESTTVMAWQLLVWARLMPEATVKRAMKGRLIADHDADAIDEFVSAESL